VAIRGSLAFCTNAATPVADFAGIASLLLQFDRRTAHCKIAVLIRRSVHSIPSNF
jgi:hypothetical protein